MPSQTYNATKAASKANYYERMVGGSTNAINRAMLDLLEHYLPFDGSSHFLDNACGPGIGIGELVATRPTYATTMKITAADLSPDMLDQVQTKVNTLADNGTKLDVKCIVQDVRNLDKMASGSVSHASTSLGLLIPGDEEQGALKAVSEIFRVLKPGGVSAFATWADRVMPDAFVNAAKTVRSDLSGVGGQWRITEQRLKGSWLFSKLEEAGFGKNVMVKPVQVDMYAQDFETLAQNILLGKMLFWKGLSEEEIEKAGHALPSELRKLETFSESPDCSARITVTAWIGVGWKSLDIGKNRASI